MDILKFGGTSVGSPSRIKAVAQLINNNRQKIVVLSAMSGTTDKLISISNLIQKKKKKVKKEINILEDSYLSVVNKLLITPHYSAKCKQFIQNRFAKIKSKSKLPFSTKLKNEILAEGEILSTNLLHYYLEEQGVKNKLISALDFMKIGKNGEPKEKYIKQKLEKIIHKNKNHDLFITQGFICKNTKGEIDNLKRGGSDYSASIIGAVLKANSIQIWTDIDGMHNNDPRYVNGTTPIAKLSFDEAAELAYFGAKILHPSSITPAKAANVPVLLKNTIYPQAQGTLISTKTSGNGIKAIAAKDGITAIKIKSDKMLLAYGFLRKVFEIFENHKTPIDTITTSEVSVSLTIDNTTNLRKITNDLMDFGKIKVENDLSIVCIVGNFTGKSKGHAQEIFKALGPIPIHMISYGGSNHNVSIIVKANKKVTALKRLNKLLK